MKTVKKYWCLALAVIVYVATLIAWFNPEDMDILWSSMFNYLLIFPICGIILGIHYGRCISSWKWILPFCVFIAVMIHDVIVGYILFDKVELDPGQIPMYLCTVVPCTIVEIITHYIVMSRRKKAKAE